MQTIIRLLFVFILFVLFTYTATAQTTYTWNGGSGDWNVASNWTPVGVPGAGDNAVIISGTVTLTTNVTVAGLELSSTLTGDFNLLVTNLMIWNGGVMQGTGVTTIDASATLRLSGGNQQTLRRQIDNNGTTIWEAGQFYLADAVAINNNGTFLDQHSGTKTLSGGSFGCVFNNNGTYTKSGVGESKLDIPFYNIGSLDLQVGILRFQILCTSSGTINVGNGSVLKLQGPQLDIISGPLSGAGTVDFGASTYIRGIYDITGSTIFSNRTTVFDTSATIVSLNNGQELLILGTAEFNTGNEIVIDSLYLSGTLQGSDPVTIMESMNWNSQVMQGTGVTTIAAGAILRLTGTNQQTLRRRIDNNGTIIWEAGQFYLADGVAINNNGTFLDQHPSPQQLSGGANGCVFNNNGTYTKSNTGQSDIRLPFYNIPGSEIRGTGTMRILWYDFTNGGTVSPGDSIGTLTLDISNYPTETTSSLDIEISGPLSGTQYDQLEITGTATLSGTLNINLLNGYIPDVGEEFTIMTFSSRVDTFDVVNGWLIGGYKFFTLLYSDTEVTLVVNEITGTNPPVANPDSARTVRDNTVAINVLLNDTDPDNDPLFLFDVLEPQHGTAIIVSDSIINYTPDPSFLGEDNFIYIIQDLPGCFSSAMVTVSVDSITVGIEDTEADIPTSYSLEQNYPNPFNPSTTIKFQIPESSSVTLKIYDIVGNEIALLINQEKPAGYYDVEFNASSLASGIYFYRLQANEFVKVKKMILLK